VQPGDNVAILTGPNAGGYAVKQVLSQTTLLVVITASGGFPSVPSTNEDYEVAFGSRWEPGVLDVLSLQLTARIDTQASRQTEIEDALADVASGVYVRRSPWVDALVNRAHGSWTAYESTLATITLLESQQSQLEALDSNYEEFLNQ